VAFTSIVLEGGRGTRLLTLGPREDTPLYLGPKGVIGKVLPRSAAVKKKDTTLKGSITSIVLKKKKRLFDWGQRK
jgi:hypothetical protein